ncbi:hypothetical protein KKE28_03830 [Patescibacteria group bacterium]|nr:hypothetical protein [Patescibacteria group bacterium]
MEENLVKELEEIGLSEKEARIYLAALELGPATAQQIATKALINRPTTYIMIESLTKKGLMSSYRKGKKTMFDPSPPTQLKYILANQKRILEKRQTQIENLILRLSNKTSTTAQNKAAVTLIEGIEGVIDFQNSVLQMSTDHEIFELVNIDESKKYIPKDVFADDLRNTIKSLYRIKCLYTSDEKVALDKLGENIIFKSIKTDDKIDAELIIYGQKATFIIYNDPPSVLTISSSAIAKTLSAIFNVAWQKS